MDPLNKNRWNTETVDRSNFEKVLPLIAAYQRFYEVTPDEERNRAFFQRFLDDHTQGVMFVALDDDGAAIGFATLYFVPSSLGAKISCSFNDLYVKKEVRSLGVGVALGIHALMYARDHGYRTVSWLTQPTNKIAQQIYEFTEAKRSDWYLYELTLPERAVDA